MNRYEVNNSWKTIYEMTDDEIWELVEDIVDEGYIYGEIIA